jgi:Protein of unknown function (DUF2817)
MRSPLVPHPAYLSTARIVDLQWTWFFALKGDEMNKASFNADYSVARMRFREAATAAGAELHHYSYPAPGPSGEELTTDVAWIGSRHASSVLVTVSGTHGIEGICGSGAQVDWLERGEAKRLSGNIATMLVHAINPYGFAWRRRVTHENVDLNRNWIGYDEQLPANEAYNEIANALCPAEWTNESRERSMQELKAYIGKHSFPAFVQTVSGGQYEHPNGLFYGGAAPTAARRTLTMILSEQLSSAAHVGIIDYHSGLGPAGFGETIAMASRGSVAYERARDWYGRAVTSVSSGSSSSAKIEGGWIGAAPKLLPHAVVTAIALEFGTVEPLAVLDALRSDNWVHAHGDPLSTQGAAIKSDVTKAFYVDSDFWRGMVLGQSLMVCRQAIAGLQVSP